MEAANNSYTPELSVVVAIVSDANHLEGCLTALSHQVDPPKMEIIVPYNGHDTTIATLEPHFSEVKFFPVDRLRTLTDLNGATREHHDELRAIGLQLAKGDILALIEDHGRVDQDWARSVVQAHRNPPAAVGGAIDNEVDRPLNWAIYFCDFGRYQNPVREGPSAFLSDANISYKRQALDKVKNVWKHAFRETSVNAALMTRGQTLWLSPKVRVYQHRDNLRFVPALKERYVWGRSYAGTRAQEITPMKRLIYLVMSFGLPFLLTARKMGTAFSKKQTVGAFIRALPFTFSLLTVWSIGEFVGYLTARPSPYHKKDRLKSSKHVPAQA